MADSYQSLRDLDLTKEEVERLGSALKDKEFRQLLSDYVEEIQDPENRKIFEAEVAQLERERGVDVTFINPVPGYVIKTSVNGLKKCFVNVCSNENIGKPTSTPSCQDGSKGLQWTLPHSLSPPRDDLDNKRVRCQVFDVVFHPDTLHLACNNAAFRNMVNRTACEAVEAQFDVKLDFKNLKFPKLQYKGMPHATIVRKPLNEKPSEKLSGDEQALLDKIYSSIPKPESPKKPKKPPTKTPQESGDYTTPKYTIKHRSHVELEDFTYEKSCKLNAATPKELVVEIHLPLLKSAGDITLDVTEKTVQLFSEKPARYKLHLALPYEVMHDDGNAKFDKDQKKLLVTLPVKRNTRLLLSDHDSGVESDHGSPVSTPPTERPLVEELPQGKPPFIDDSVQYNLPEFTCHVSDAAITFTLQVKNVSESTIETLYNDVTTSLHVKFTSISSGFFPVHYAFYVRLPEHFIDTEQVSIEPWDNNVVVQMGYKPCDKPITSYLVGVRDEQATLRHYHPTHSKDQATDDEDLVQQDRTATQPKPRDVQKANVVLDTVALKDEPASKPLRTTAIDIDSACSESSGDELSYSYSPSKCKGILKRMSSARSSVSRSISESSIDDLMWTSSFENCYNSMDSVIPEDVEASTSLKKTVRFNDNVTRQLFRSNSSILGQKKKNQRKARNKKRAQERRHSESELSESEDKKERELKTKPSDEQQQEKKEENHIFEFDM